jgi:hypothetical protein
VVTRYAVSPAAAPLDTSVRLVLVPSADTPVPQSDAANAEFARIDLRNAALNALTVGWQTVRGLRENGTPVLLPGAYDFGWIAIVYNSHGGVAQVHVGLMGPYAEVWLLAQRFLSNIDPYGQITYDKTEDGVTAVLHYKGHPTQTATS